MVDLVVGKQRDVHMIRFMSADVVFVDTHVIFQGGSSTLTNDYLALS